MLTESMKRAILDGRFEETEDGLFVPRERMMIQGIVTFNKRGEPEEYTHNLIVTQGLNYLVGAATGAVAAIGTWYVAVFSGDVTVQATWTAANFAANSTEFTQYAAANRPTWQPGAVASGARDSFSTKAEFESTTDGAILRGAALISSSTKAGTSGTLLGAVRFPSDKPLDTGEALDVGYGLQLTAVT
jgi:hypothetical protein